jgi:hypothetical protein
MLVANRRFCTLSRPPPIDHPCPLPNGQTDARPVLDRTLKHRVGSAQAVAGVEQAIDLPSVPRPFLDLVEIEH